MNTLALQAIQHHLAPHSAILIEDPCDLFYLLQKPISLGSLFIEPKQATLFVDGRYLSAFKSIQGLQTLPSEHHGFFNFLKKTDVKQIDFDGEKTSFDRGQTLKAQHAGFQAKSHLLTHLRLIKTDTEIALIRQSAHLLAAIYQQFLSLPKVGLTEKQLATQFKTLSLEKGAEGFSFEPIIATGPNTAYPHHRPTNRLYHEGDILLIDIGITQNNYQSDMTRMVFFGHVDPKLLTYHDYVLEAHQAALKLCKPGVKLGQLDEAARAVFKKHHVEHLFCHSLGHGLGLETHESPRIKFDGVDKDLLLQKNMVITIEPGLYEEGLGGIRHEDLICITDTGYENFYPNYF